MSAVAAPVWSRGTDLRKDGIYCWPHPNIPAETRTYYPAVSSVLELIEGTTMRFAEFWFIAEYVEYVTLMAEGKSAVECWDDATKSVILRPAREVLKDKNWIKMAGAREMRRRANRGTVIHDAFEDYTLHEIRVTPSEIRDYVGSLIEHNGFALPVEFCAEHVEKLLGWCKAHILETLMSEAVVMNDTDAWAGTVDWMGHLKDVPNVPESAVCMVDAKGSKNPQKAHALQVAGAYNHAEWIGVKGTDIRVPFSSASRVFNLYIQPEGAKLREWENGEAAYQHFLYLRAVWQWWEQNDKSVLVKVPKIKVPHPPAQPDLYEQLKASIEVLQGGQL